MIDEKNIKQKGKSFFEDKKNVKAFYSKESL